MTSEAAYSFPEMVQNILPPGVMPLSKWECAASITVFVLMSVSAWLAFEGWVFIASLVLGSVLIALSIIDLKTYRLPHALTYAMIALGLAVNAALGIEYLFIAALGALSGYLSLWIIRELYHRIRGRDGIGGGDITLVAAAGAWVGALALPWVIGMASVSALLMWLSSQFPILLRKSGRGDAQKQTPNALGASRLPFGPSLALGTWLTWVLI